MACIQSGPTATLFGTVTLSGTRTTTTVSTETITRISTSISTTTTCVQFATPTTTPDDEDDDAPLPPQDPVCVSSTVITAIFTTPITETIPRTITNTIDTQETQTRPTATLSGCIRTADPDPETPPPTPRPETPTPTPTPTPEPEPEPEPEVSTSFPPPVVVTITRTITSNGSTYFTKAESMSTPPPTLVPGVRDRGDEVPIGPIIGGVVGGLAGLLGLIALVWYIIVRRRRSLDDIFDDGEDDVVGELKSDKPAKFGFAPFRRKKRFNVEDDDDLSSDRAQTPYEYGVVGARRAATGTHPLDSSIGTHSHTPSVGSNTYAPGHVRATSNTPLMSGQSPPASPTRTTTSIWTPSTTSNVPLWQPAGHTTPGQPPIWADPAAAGYFGAAAAGGAGGHNVGHGYGYGAQAGSVYYPPGAAPPVAPVVGMHPGSSSPPVHPQPIHPPPAHPPPNHPPGMSTHPQPGLGGAPIVRRTSTHKPPLEQTLHGSTRPLHPHQPAPEHTRNSAPLMDEPIPPELLIAAGLGDASSTTSSTTRSGGRVAVAPRNEKSGGLGLVGSPPVSPVTPQATNAGVVQVPQNSEPLDAPPAYTQV